MNNCDGFQVLESVHATMAGDPVEVRRTWRERLLTRPWRPWKRTRTERPMRPAMFRIGPNTLLVHPAMLGQIRTISKAQRGLTEGQ